MVGMGCGSRAPAFFFPCCLNIVSNIEWTIACRKDIKWAGGRLLLFYWGMCFFFVEATFAPELSQLIEKYGEVELK